MYTRLPSFDVKLGIIPQIPNKCIQWVLIYKHLVRWMVAILHTLWCRVKPDIVYAHGSMHNTWLNSRTCEGKSKQMSGERMEDGSVKEGECREKLVFYINTDITWQLIKLYTAHGMSTWYSAGLDFDGRANLTSCQDKAYLYHVKQAT